MKLHVFSKSIFVILMAFFTVASLHAQSDPAPGSKTNRTEKRQKQEDRYAKELNFTEEQKTRFKKIDDDYSAQAREKRAAKKEEMTRIREEKIKAHKAVLTPEQAAKYDEMLAKKQVKKEHRKKKKMGKKGHHKQKKAEKKAIKEELNKQ